MAAGGIKVHIYGDYDDKDINRAIKDLNALKSQASGGQGPMDGLSGAFGKLALAAGGLFALKEVAGFIQDAVGAAIEDEKSTVALAKAMDNLGLSAQKVDLEKTISKMSLLYGVADDQLRPAMVRLVTATRDVGKAQQGLQLALDLAAAGYGTVETASMALSKAATGNIGALKRLGVPLDANIVKTKDYDGAVAALSKTFAGQARAAASTYGGSLQRLSVAYEEARESFGKAFLEGFIGNAQEAADKTDELMAMFEEARPTIEAIGTGVGTLVKGILLFAESLRGVVVGATYAFVQALNDLYNRYIDVADALGIMSDEQAQFERDRQVAIAAAQEQAYYEDLLGYKFGENVAATQEASAATQQHAQSLAQASTASDKAYSAIVHATDALKTWQQALSQSGSMDKWKGDLLAIETKFKDVNKSLSDNSQAGLKNRDAIRGYASDLITAVEDWGNRYDKTVTQRIERQATEGKKLRDALIAAGFKAKDVDAYLGGVGLWSAQMQLIAGGLTRGQAATAMRYAGMALGRNTYLGIVAGLNEGKDDVRTAAYGLAGAANAGAQAALDIGSPSKVWRKYGGWTADGLIEGMLSKKDKVKSAAEELANAVIDKGQAIVDGWDAKLGRLKDRLDAAKADMADFSKSVSDSIMGAFDFASIAPKMDESGQMVGGSFMDGLRAQAAQAQNFAAQVRQLIAAGLSQQALTMVLDAGTQAGTAIATELIAGGATTIAQTNDLVSTTQAAADEVGALAGQNFYGAGVASAQATYDGFKANFGAGGPARVAMENLMDHLASSLSRTVTVTVQSVYQAAGIAGKRALGGPVSANMAYLVGERGPEVFVPNGGGNIIPNSTIGSGGFGGGRTYNINVSAGVGDPRMIGQQVVEYIRRFEQANGNVFAPAA